MYDCTIHVHVQQTGARTEQLEGQRVERALDPHTRAQVVAEASERLADESFSLVIEVDGWMVRKRGSQVGDQTP